MIEREETGDGIRITSHDMKEREEDCDTRAAIDRLHESRGVLGFHHVLSVIFLVRARENENLSIPREDWLETTPRLREKAFIADDAAELLRPRVAGNPSR